MNADWKPIVLDQEPGDDLLQVGSNRGTGPCRVPGVAAIHDQVHLASTIDMHEDLNGRIRVHDGGWFRVGDHQNLVRLLRKKQNDVADSGTGVEYDGIVQEDPLRPAAP